MRKLKYIAPFLLSICMLTTGYSQGKHEYSAALGGGLSSLQYSVDFGDRTSQMGGSFSLGYGYNFNQEFSLQTGVELSIYQSKVEMNQFNSIQLGLRDADDHNLSYKSAVSGYEEKQSAMYINIPVMVRYQTNGKTKFYGALGPKIGIPISGKYKGSGATFVNKGYFPDFNNTLDAPTHMGFGTFKDKDVDESLDYKVAIMLSAEAGLKWELSSGKAIYTGIYFDYGLNDIIKDSRDQSFVVYNKTNPTEFTNNSVLNSSYDNNGKLQKFTSKVAPMAVGIKVHFSIDGFKKKQ